MSSLLYPVVLISFRLPCLLNFSTFWLLRLFIKKPSQQLNQLLTFLRENFPVSDFTGWTQQNFLFVFYSSNNGLFLCMKIKNNMSNTDHFCDLVCAIICTLYLVLFIYILWHTFMSVWKISSRPTLFLSLLFLDLNCISLLWCGVDYFWFFTASVFIQTSSINIPKHLQRADSWHSVPAGSQGHNLLT